MYYWYRMFNSENKSYGNDQTLIAVLPVKGNISSRQLLCCWLCSTEQEYPKIMMKGLSWRHSLCHWFVERTTKKWQKFQFPALAGCFWRCELIWLSGVFCTHKTDVGAPVKRATSPRTPWIIVKSGEAIEYKNCPKGQALVGPHKRTCHNGHFEFRVSECRGKKKVSSDRGWKWNFPDVFLFFVFFSFFFFS